ncbi:MAG: sigma-70 family RNA polymerase sigma factor [Phycisphaerales bacterium]|nr:sigma-70 family RNA polymerase sigma factor [Phycisphaerales bacterium]
MSRSLSQNPEQSTDIDAPIDLESVRSDLRALARMLLSRERLAHTLQPTALLNELWLYYLKVDRVVFNSEAEVLAWASRVLRHLLVDHARRRHALKRGGRMARLSLDDAAGRTHPDLLELNEALIRLEQRHPRSAQVVEMRYFGGMTDTEIAERLGVTDRTVRADWAAARAWLFSQLHRPEG